MHRFRCTLRIAKSSQSRLGPRPVASGESSVVACSRNSTAYRQYRSISNSKPIPPQFLSRSFRSANSVAQPILRYWGVTRAAVRAHPGVQKYYHTQERSQLETTNMATATTIKLSTADTGVFSTGVRADSAEVASQVLQEDLQKHHIYFNVDRFHSKPGSACLEHLWLVPRSLTMENLTITRSHRPSCIVPLCPWSVPGGYQDCLRAWQQLPETSLPCGRGCCQHNNRETPVPRLSREGGTLP